ncbi:alpha/beta hydrolase [Parvibacter caecicola]|uniref:alpha/beta hydrolase n=1 Tax=Parvibacter caecicola TaxID=747645 RepID=UPI0023F23E4D|nr:alpha/beta hydrolase [Parvibacter caecicola]
MAMSKLAQKAVAAITRLQPDPSEGYLAQRKAEDAAGKLTVASPRCRIDNLSVTADDGYEIPCRVFTPLDVDFSLRTGLKVTDDYRGTILFFHGGGWANGDVDFYSDACMRTALKLERRVVAVEYRRSPEFKFPRPLMDCYNVACALFAKQLLPDVRVPRIVLMGDSAGGNLAAGVACLARDRGDFRPNNMVLLYPLTYSDHSPATIFDSVRENGEGFILTREAIVDYTDMYINGPEDLENPLLAPLLTPDLGNLPRTLVITAEYDPLRDEGEAFAARLEADGTEVECVRIRDAVHGYYLYPSVLSFVRDTYDLLEEFLNTASPEHGGKGPSGQAAAGPGAAAAAGAAGSNANGAAGAGEAPGASGVSGEPGKGAAEAAGRGPKHAAAFKGADSAADEVPENPLSALLKPVAESLGLGGAFSQEGRKRWIKLLGTDSTM